MADATRLQTLSKQSDEQRQATEVITTQTEKLTQSQAQIDELIQSHQRMEAMMAALMSQRSNQLSRPPDPPYSASGDLTSYSQAPQPPDPPDIRKSRQDLTIKAPDLPDFNQSELISTNQVPNKLALRYSCEEIHERMANGLCIFCEDLDTPGHYNLKHKRSKICLVECVDDRLPDEELVEPAVEEISNKSVTMIQDEESNPENESRPEVSVSQFQVPFSSMEPSHRCHNHYESLDVVDERMCNELVCDEDGDSIITKSAKSHETYEEPQFELVCLKQSHDPVENHLDNFEFALTRSSQQHSPTDQYRAPFNPCQNCNDQCHYKRKFGNYTEHETEFDRASEEVEDDELQDKQTEDNNSVVENQKKLARKIEMPVFENLHELSRLFDDGSQRTLGDHTLAAMKPYQSYSQSWYELDTIQPDINFKVLVAHECDMVSAVVIYEVATTFEKLAKTWKFKFKSNPRRSKLLDDMFSFMEKLSEKYVMVLESQQGNDGLSLLNFLIDHNVLRPWICLGVYNSSLEAKLELSGWKYKKQINRGQICLNGLCNELVMESRLPLHYWVAWRKLILWEVLCILQNNAHRLLLVIHELQKRMLCFWSSNGRIGTASGELQEWNVVARHLLFNMVEKSNYLDEVIEEVAKTFILAMIDEHKDIKTACVFLEMGLNKERLIQLGAPLVFSDLLCVMNRIRVCCISEILPL